MAWRGVVVDVSNVCRDPELAPTGPHASLERLDAVVQAWVRAHPAAEHLVLVADESLQWLLGDEDRRRLARMRARDDVVLAPDADAVLLERAHAEGLLVLSRDKFRDHRRTHPWIERQPERFFTWQVRTEAVQIVAADVRFVAPAIVSQYEEVKELRLRGVDPNRDQSILRRRWRCTDAACFQARLSPDHLLVWPAIGARGEALCPWCSGPLVDVGRRRRMVQLVVACAATGAETMRFPLEVGSPVTVGRSSSSDPPDIDVTKGIPARRAQRVSRRHASLELSAHGEPKVRVTDEASTRGTVLIDGSGAQTDIGGGSATLRRNGRLLLAGEVTLRISGLRFVADDVAPTLRPEGDRSTEIG